MSDKNIIDFEKKRLEKENKKKKPLTNQEIEKFNKAFEKLGLFNENHFENLNDCVSSPEMLYALELVKDESHSGINIHKSLPFYRIGEGAYFSGKGVKVFFEIDFSLDESFSDKAPYLKFTFQDSIEEKSDNNNIISHFDHESLDTLVENSELIQKVWKLHEKLSHKFAIETKLKDDSTIVINFKTLVEGYIKIKFNI